MRQLFTDRKLSPLYTFYSHVQFSFYRHIGGQVGTAFNLSVKGQGFKLLADQVKD